MSHRKVLISNFFSFSGLQFANQVMPLITLPYLVRVLGPEKFGLIAFSHAFIQYFILLTDYGFNLSAAREISINRNNKKKVSEIFCSVMIIKIVLMTLSFLTLCLLVFNIDRFSTEGIVYLLTFGMVIGNVIFPVWFFQGMERMKQIAVLNFIVKMIFTASIFIFIKSQSDYIYVPLLNSLGFVATGIISLWIVFREYEVKMKKPTFTEIKHELKAGWHIFISTIGINLYTTSSVFILGIFTNNTIVGFYTAGERIVRAAIGLLNPLSQTVFPHISKLSSESRDVALAFISRLFKLVSVSTFLISLILLIFANPVTDILLGKQYSESIPVIQILSFLPFLIGLSNILVMQLMFNFGLKKTISKIVLAGAIISVSLTVILVQPLQHIGVAVAWLITEIFIISASFLFVQSSGIRVLWFIRNKRSTEVTPTKETQI